MQVSVYRKYDGYVYQDAEVVSQTKATADVQIPGYFRPVRFRRMRHDKTKLTYSVSGLYMYLGET